MVLARLSFGHCLWVEMVVVREYRRQVDNLRCSSSKFLLTGPNQPGPNLVQRSALLLLRCPSFRLR